MEEPYKKDPDELDDNDGVVSHPEPDILEKVKWALGSTAVNKASADTLGKPGECSVLSPNSGDTFMLGMVTLEIVDM